jgi:hypothetical protein
MNVVKNFFDFENEQIMVHFISSGNLNLRLVEHSNMCAVNKKVGQLQNLTEPFFNMDLEGINNFSIDNKIVSDLSSAAKEDMAGVFNKKDLIKNSF